MADRPIIFSAAMIRALLDGRKTQTRRLIKPQPSAGVRYSPFVVGGLEDGHGRRVACHYAPGDRLWCRESHAVSANLDLPVWYRQGHSETSAPGPRVDVKWRPSIHMPRWASRLTLIVENVRVQQLQDISEEDALAEGTSGLVQFFGLWDSINADRAPWASNPWICALTFRVIKANIDAVEEHEVA